MSSIIGVLDGRNKIGEACNEPGPEGVVAFGKAVTLYAGLGLLG